MKHKNNIHISKDGRIYIYCPNHPHKNSNGYVLLSRLIVENRIGRYLNPKETVHHKDENRWNNHPDNLELYDSQSHHAKMHGEKRILNDNLAKLRNRSWLIQEYQSKKRSLTDIAQELNTADRTIANWLDHHNIPRRRYTLTNKAMQPRIKGAQSRKPRNIN